MEVRGQVHVKKCNTRERTLGTCCTESWVGPRPGLDMVIKIPAPAIN
jgi:hypothetical protein